MRPRVRRNTLGPRSTLRNHSFPPFYACYLLKSVKSAYARSTYVGSTPHPPRRLRQHNGEISAGAWKTRHGRPWVMTMNVYGFPSKLAALQFEWAWQHPTKSRHLRNAGEVSGSLFPKSTSSANLLRNRVAAVRAMLRVPPYNTWPLRVKIYSEDVAKLWDKIPLGSLSLGTGVEVSHEFEGVDGKSGDRGSGRSGPIDVADREFTTEHLRKYELLTSTSTSGRCGCCNERITFAKPDPLQVTLCTHEDCSSVSHIRCLAKRFLQHSEAPLTSSSLSRHGGLSTMIPRGGTCPGCDEWTLWGDLIRGCYRRQAGAVNAVADEAQEFSEKEASDGEEVSDLNGEERLETAMNKVALSEGSKGAGSASSLKRSGRPPKSSSVSPTVQRDPRGRPPKLPKPVRLAETPQKRGTQRKQPASSHTRGIHTTSRRIWESSDEADTSLEMIDIEGVDSALED